MKFRIQTSTCSQKLFSRVGQNICQQLKKKIDNSNLNYTDIYNVYFFDSNRWDIETRDGNLIKLPRNNIMEILNLYVRMTNEKKINEKTIIDFRQKNQIILNEK